MFTDQCDFKRLADSLNCRARQEAFRGALGNTQKKKIVIKSGIKLKSLILLGIQPNHCAMGDDHEEGI